MRVELILEAIDRASSPIKKVAAALIGVERTAKASEGIARIGRGLGMAASRAAGLAVAATGAAAGLAASMVDTASAFETMETTLVTTEGSQAKARAAMAWVSDFAAKTPYELAQVGDAFVRLRSYGIDPTTGMLKTLGDASSAMGKPMMQAVEAMADAVTGENERLKEFGIRASVNKNADKVIYSYMDLAGKVQTVTARLSDQADIAAKVSGIFDSKFGGAMERQSRTWVGLMSNLSDQWSRFQLMIMSSGLFDWMRGKLEHLLSTLDAMAKDGRLQQWATEIGRTIQTVLVAAWKLAVGVTEAVQTIAPYVAAIVDFVGGARNAMLLLGGLALLRPILLIGQGVAMLIGALTPLVPLLMAAASAAWAFAVALMANPIAWVIAGLVALAAAAYLIYQNWDRIGPMLAALWASIKATLQAAWNGMIAWLAGLGDRIAAALSAGWTAVSTWVAGVGADIVDGLASSWSAVTSWFAGVQWPSLPVLALATISPFTALATALGVDWRALEAWFSGLSWPALPELTVFDDIRAALEPAIRWIDEWGGRLVGAFATAFDKVSAFVGGAATTIGDAFSKVTGALASASELVFGPSAASVSASEGDIARVAAAATAARGLIDAIPPAAQAAVAMAGGILAAANFHSQGVAMMRTLAEGIKAGAASAVAAVRATVQQVRDLLPHSPARTGPLSDLDRVQFGQTLAGAIHAGQPKAIAAARAIAAAIAATLPVATTHATPVATATMPAPAGASRPTFARAAPGLGGGGVSRVTSVHVALTLAPTLAGGGDAVAQLKAALPHIGFELAEAVRTELDRRERTKH